jgi:hypothetical protein
MAMYHLKHLISSLFAVKKLEPANGQNGQNGQDQVPPSTLDPRRHGG